jgi:hypothetical protein
LRERVIAMRRRCRRLSMRGRLRHRRRLIAIGTEDVKKMTKTPKQIERDRTPVISPAGAENPMNIQLKHEEKMLQELLGNTLLKAVDQWIAGQNDRISADPRPSAGSSRSG